MDLYTDYLLSSFSQVTATGLSNLLEGSLSHDQITRMLSGQEYDSKDLWQEVKSLVRTHESADACLIFDDTLISKPYTDENVFKNPNIIISLPNEELDTILQIDAVLGMDFIRRVGEIHIYLQENKIVFPVKKTALPLHGRNLLFANAYPYLKAYSNAEKLFFQFDMGNAKTDLHNVYYEKHKEELEKTGNKTPVRRGGYGGIIYVDAYQIAKFPLTVGDCDAELTDVDVLINENFHYLTSNEDGSIGMDFITLFKKVIINFDEMFLIVEK